MGLAQTLSSVISAFDSVGKQNTQQDVAMQKIDVNNFWKQAQMTFDAGKFLTNTKITLDRMDMEERKRVFGAYDTTIDNISSQISADEVLKSREVNKSVINMLNKRIKDNRTRRLRMEEVSEKLYPTEKKIFDAGQAGYDISGLQQEGDQLYGEDIDPKTLEGERGGNGSQRGFDRSAAPTRITPSPVQMPTERHGQRTPERISNDSIRQDIPSDTKVAPRDVSALKQQVQDLIGQVQTKISGVQDRQPLDIPGARQPTPIAQPTTTPQDMPLTVAQREANKYIGEKEIKLEQEQYDRYLTSLTSKYKYLDRKGMSVDDEIKITETDILEKQKLIQWIDMMASTGRTRSVSPTDILGTGIQQLMAKIVPGFESILTKPKSVMTAWGKRYSTDTTSIQNDIERAKIKIDELNQLAELYVPGGGRPSEAQEQINTGMTAEQRNIATRRNKLFGAYRR